MHITRQQNKGQEQEDLLLWWEVLKLEAKRINLQPQVHQKFLKTEIGKSNILKIRCHVV